MKMVSHHGWPMASDGNDANAFEAFKNERYYIAQVGHLKTTVAAMDWAAREIERLRQIVIDMQELRLLAGDTRYSDEAVGMAFRGRILPTATGHCPIKSGE